MQGGSGLFFTNTTAKHGLCSTALTVASHIIPSKTPAVIKSNQQKTKEKKGLCMLPGVKCGTAGSCQSGWPEEVTVSHPPSQSAYSFTPLRSGSALNCSTGSQG